ncbi:hypothetical protein GCM10009830_41730 [Glycomyces endophyticus]|uniref:Uncharacterized protein n=1 Tax=Glycomyces endophyticus TaxID=480996 RepID=A0ABN2HLX8_9ACTN
MKKFRIIVVSLGSSLVITLAATVVALMLLMFSTSGDEPVRKTALFDAVYFEVTEATADTTSVTMGVDGFVPLLVVFAVVAAFIALVQIILDALQTRRRHLLAQRSE